jgi:CheY-like chemotaxis protein
MIHTSHSDSATPLLLLLVDPNGETYDLYRPFLVPRRYIVEHAQEGREALARTLARPPDVIVTETRVPGIDGISLCELWRHDPATQRIPILMVTADARPAVADAALRVGATEVLVKPCLPDELWRALLRARETPVAADRPVVEERLRGTLRRRHQHYVTNVPPASPPPLHCPQCDAMLAYERSHIGGVSAKHSEQWDDYHCPMGCGVFQYRHRTRKVSHAA